MVSFAVDAEFHFMINVFQIFKFYSIFQYLNFNETLRGELPYSGFYPEV